MAAAQPLPDTWRIAVKAILTKGSGPWIRWSLRAQQDWQLFGLPQDAYALLARVLEAGPVWGEKVTGMTPLPGKAPPPPIETWAFLCPHPLGIPKPLYAKIGLHGDRISLDLFSLHIDLSGELATKIAAAKKKKRP